ncbi:DsbA family protein [Aestuariimicrobium ganziense]|uniref:DsbA family protein n=1 Tax=Aestuariimicrobium ganziense TaxID=2773677 RepID=UPI001F1E0460|nr:thioredoxin domain-containing protein [Aestuariimicrobium ganziense]
MSKASNQRSGKQRANSQRAASTRREQLRAQQLAEAKKRQRTMRIFTVLGAVVALAVIAIVAVVVVNDRNAKKEQAAQEAASQITPPSALADGTGYAWKVGNPAADAPTITIYEDFQCPACKSTEEYFGPTLAKLAEDGKIKVEYRILTFMDTNLRNDSSERSARAAACADVSGKFKEYHDVVYKNQPQGEGSGYTDQQLRVDFPAAAGITGDDLTKFQSCYDSKSTSQWVREAFQKGSAGWEGSTPQININGKNPQVKNSQDQDTDWWRVLEPTEESWLKAIADHG